MTSIPDHILERLSPLKKIDCDVRRVSEGNSLTLGFGQRNYHNDKSLGHEYYSEWELRTFYSLWRVVKNGCVICCSHQDESNGKAIQGFIDQMQLTNITSIEMLSNLDVSIFFDEIRFDFLSADNDNEDEIINFYCPENIYIGFSPNDGWELTLSDVPKL